MIYEALLVGDYAIPVSGTEPGGISPTGPPVRILEVSRSIHQETMPILYGRNTFKTGSTPENRDSIIEWLYDRGEDESVEWPIWWANRSAWDEMVDDVSRIFDYQKNTLPKWLGRMPLLSLLRQIGPTATAMISRLCINVSGIFCGVNQCLLWLEVIRQHMPGLQTLSIEFSTINCFQFYCCNEPEDMSSIVDEAVEPFFKALERHLESSPNLINFEISGEPTFVQMGDALVQGRKRGHEPDVMDIWKQRVVDPELLEVYYKYIPLYWLSWSNKTVALMTSKPAEEWIDQQDVLIEGSRIKVV